MVWTGFILGFVGSLHCAGMCGPLALALPVPGTSRSAFIASRLIYNAGRILTYSCLGAALGLLGETLSLAGLQRWLSVSAGAFILLGLVAANVSFKKSATRLVLWIKSIFAETLRRRTCSALLLLGAANGLFPCGLVYVAAAAAAATGRVGSSIEYMVAFGAGTLPMMMAIPLLRRTLSLRFGLQKFVPITVFLVAVLLILRGLSLGIPYLSPSLETHCGACH